MNHIATSLRYMTLHLSSLRLLPLLLFHRHLLQYQRPRQRPYHLLYPNLPSYLPPSTTPTAPRLSRISGMTRRFSIHTTAMIESHYRDTALELFVLARRRNHGNLDPPNTAKHLTTILRTYTCWINWMGIPQRTSERPTGLSPRARTAIYSIGD